MIDRATGHRVSKLRRGPRRAGLAVTMLLASFLPPSVQAQAVPVAIDPSIEHQGIDGFGANQPQYYYVTDYFGGSMLDLAFKRSGMGMSLLRCDMPFGFEGKQGTSAGNDDSDPQWIDWAGFDTSVLAPLAAVAQGASARGCEKLVASPWSPPYWMKDNQDEQNGGHFVAGMEAELAEYFRAFLTYMANGTGEVDPPVLFDHVTVQNEPDISAQGWHCGYTTAQLTLAMQYVGDMLADEFPWTTLAAGDNSTTTQTVSYLNAIMADGVVAPMVGVYAVHPYNLNNYPGGISWGNWTNPDSRAGAWDTYRNNTDAIGYGLRSWMLEHCDHDQVTNPDPSRATWTSGLDGATHIHRALVNGGVSAWSGWTLFRRNAELSGSGYGHALWYSEAADGNSTLKATGKVSAFTPFYRYVRPGYVRVEASPSDASTDLRVTAFKAPGGVDDGLVVVVINRGSSPVDLDGTIAGAGSIPRLHRCEATAHDAGRATPHGVHGGPSVPLAGGGFSATVPARSVTAFVHEAGAPWPRAVLDFDGADLSASFDASASTPETTERYEWDFGDGAAAEGVDPTHVYEEAGTYEVFLTVTDARGGVDTLSETVTVGTDPAILGSARYYRSSQGHEPGDYRVGGATLELAGETASQSTTSDPLDGSYGFAGLPLESMTVTPGKDGDFDGISSLDAAILSQFRVGLVDLTSNQQIAGDVSGNGAISSYDAALISQFRVGLIAHFPIAVQTGHDWAWAPGSRSYEPLDGHRSGEDYLAILYGDVTGNWTPSGRDAEPEAPLPPWVRESSTPIAPGPGVAEASRAAGPCRLALRPSGDFASESGSVAWSVVGRGCGGVLALDLDIGYDPRGLTMVEATGAGAGSAFTVAFGDAAGLLRLSAYAAGPLREDGEILSIRALASATGDRPPTPEIRAASANEGRIRVRVERPQAQEEPRNARN